MKVIRKSLILLFEDLLNIIQVILFLPKAIRYNYLINNEKLIHLNEKLLVLGNGPSLYKTIEQNEKEIKNDYDIICVNGFALSDKFSIIKPIYYIIADPAIFRATKIDRIEFAKNELFETINSKTNWPLLLFLPHNARKNEIVKILKTNKNIKINFFFHNSIFGGHDLINQFYFKLKLANPLYQSVLIAAIFIGITNNYKDIRLVGADHSWLENYKIGADNSLYLHDKHYTNNASDPILLTKEDGTNIHLHEELYSLYRCFSVYHQLESYAKIKGIEIVNYTTNSWIDAFSRKSFLKNN